MPDERSPSIKQRSRSFAVLPGHISVVLLSNSGRVPLKNVDYVLHLSPRRTARGATDGDGFLLHEDLPQGRYRIELPAFSCALTVPSVPRDIERLAVRVPVMLFGNTGSEEALPRYREGGAIELGEPAEAEEGWEDLEDA